MITSSGEADCIRCGGGADGSGDGVLAILSSSPSSTGAGGSGGGELGSRNMSKPLLCLDRIRSVVLGSVAFAFASVRTGTGGCGGAFSRSFFLRCDSWWAFCRCSASSASSGSSIIIGSGDVKRRVAVGFCFGASFVCSDCRDCDGSFSFLFLLDDFSGATGSSKSASCVVRSTAAVRGSVRVALLFLLGAFSCWVVFSSSAADSTWRLPASSASRITERALAIGCRVTGCSVERCSFAGLDGVASGSSCTNSGLLCTGACASVSSSS